MYIDIIAAIAAVSFWGTYLAPSNRLGLSPYAKSLYLTLGNLALAAAMTVVYAPFASSVNFAYSTLAGLIWSAGGLFAFVGIEQMGLTRGPGIWNPGKTMLTIILGIVVFNELLDAGTTNLLIGLGGGLCLVVGMIAMTKSREEASTATQWRKGLLAVLVVAVSWSAYTVPLKLATGPQDANVLPMAIGMFIPILLVSAPRHGTAKFAESLVMVGSGVIWGIANYASFILFSDLGIARGYTITQLAIVVNTLWGILVFKEVSGRKRIALVAAGIALSVVGGYLITIAKS